MNTSISGSGLMFASFSLLANSVNMSNASPKHRWLAKSTNQIECYEKIEIEEMFKLTITRTDTLEASGVSKSLPNSHFTDMNIVLADIRSCSLWHKLVHSMTIVCHSSSLLQEQIMKFIIDSHKSYR